MTIPILMRVNSSNEFNDELPNFALLEWTRELGADIARARASCVALGYHSVRIDASATWYVTIPGADDQFDADDEHIDSDSNSQTQSGWAALHAQLEESGREYVILTQEQATYLRAQEECYGIRGEKIVIDLDGGWHLACYEKHSGDTVESSSIEFACDPWAEAHGYPDIRLHDPRTGVRLQLRLDPVTFNLLREATRVVKLSHQVTVSVLVSVMSDGSTPALEPLPRCVVTPASWQDCHPPGLATFSRYEYTFAPPDAPSDAGVRLCRAELHGLLRDASQHLSLVAS